MLPSFVLSLRESLEASLVIGLVLGVLRKLRREECVRFVWLGLGSAAVVSIALAFLLHALSWTLQGAAEPLVEGSALFLAAGLLTWMLIWMKRQSAGIRDRIEGEVRRAARAPGGGGVFALTFMAVAREGTELALFLTATDFGGDGEQTFAGAACGIAAAALLTWLLFSTTTRLSFARFFHVTTVLLILFAAGLVGKGVHEFNEAGWIPALVEPVWNSVAVLDERSAAGTVARTLLGYTSTPSLTVVLAYVVYLATAVTLFRFGARAPKQSPATGRPAAAIGQRAAEQA